MLFREFAKKKNIRWLYITDTMIAQLSILISLLLLIDLKFDLYAVLALFFIESLLFTAVMFIEKEKLLYKTG